RMALISPEALAGTKLAVNRGAEAAGFRSAIMAGLDILASVYAARTEVGARFDEIREKEGLGAALRWRAAQFAAAALPALEDGLALLHEGAGRFLEVFAKM